MPKVLVLKAHDVIVSDVFLPGFFWSNASRGAPDGVAILKSYRVGCGCLKERRLGVPGQVWEFRFLLPFPHFVGKIAVPEMSGKTPGSPRHPSSRHPQPSDKKWAQSCRLLGAAWRTHQEMLLTGCPSRGGKLRNGGKKLLLFVGRPLKHSMGFRGQNWSHRVMDAPCWRQGALDSPRLSKNLSYSGPTQLHAGLNVSSVNNADSGIRRPGASASTVFEGKQKHQDGETDRDRGWSGETKVRYCTPPFGGPPFLQSNPKTISASKM